MQAKSDDRSVGQWGVRVRQCVCGSVSLVARSNGLFCGLAVVFVRKAESALGLCDLVTQSSSEANWLPPNCIIQQKIVCLLRKF